MLQIFKNRNLNNEVKTLKRHREKHQKEIVLSHQV